MTENEAKFIISDLDSIKKRIELIDTRILEFIKSSQEIQNVSNQVEKINLEQQHIKESLERAWGKINKFESAIMSKEKIEAAIEKVNNLELAPIKENSKTIEKLKSTIFAAICGAIAMGIVGFIVWLINLYLRGIN